MHAIVIAVFIVCLLLRVMKPGKIYVLGVCILLLGLMCDTYYPVFQNIGPVRWIHSQPIFGYLGTRNALFYGVPYVCMGHYFANHEFTHKNRNQSIIRMFACFCLLVLEAVIVVKLIHGSGRILWFMVFPLTYVIFESSLNWNIVIKNSKELRIMASWLYYLHPIFILMFEKKESGISLYLSVTLASLLVSYLFFYLEERKKFGLIKSLR